MVAPRRRRARVLVVNIPAEHPTRRELASGDRPGVAYQSLVETADPGIVALIRRLQDEVRRERNRDRPFNESGCAEDGLGSPNATRPR